MTQRALTAVLLVLLVAPSLALAATPDSGPTFTEDVAPIFFNKCVTCHRPGEVAPFSLLTYSEARPWARSIARQVESRRMPPFSPESDKIEWKHDLSLEQEEIDTVVAWVKAGAPEGSRAALPEAPEFQDGWIYGEPDMVITLDEVEVPADGPDLFPKQWVTLDLEETRWVRAIQFKPGDRRATHHFLATYNSGQAGSDGRGEFDRDQGNAGSGIFGVWTAGMSPYEFPEGMGRQLLPGTRILFDNHYHPFGEATSDVTQVGLYFGEGPLEREVATMAVVNTGIRIPPGDGDYAIQGFHVFDSDMKILAFSPHMHVRGKAMRYDLTYPDGRVQNLLDVPRYDYNWQWLYYPTEPIDIPAGSRLDVTAVWDNSEDNPSNPDPSQEIIYRGDTFNEMFVAFFEAIEADRVWHQPSDPKAKLTKLLSAHPAEDTYMVTGFLPIGLYVPKQGKGWAYIVQGNGMTTVTLDDIRWQGESLEVRTQFPTADASAITTSIAGALNENGALEGTLTYGDKAETGTDPIVLPVLGQPMTEAPATGAGGGGR